MHQSINVIHYLNKTKVKYHLVQLIDTLKALDKMKCPFIKKKKSLNKLGIEGMYPNIIKDMYNKLTATVMPTHENLNVFTLRSGRGKGCHSCAF